MTPTDPDINRPDAKRPVIGVTFSWVQVKSVGRIEDIVIPLSATVTQISSVWVNKTLNKIPKIIIPEEMYENAMSLVEEI